MDMVLKPTMSLKKMVTQSKDSGSTGRPSLSAADTCIMFRNSSKRTEKEAAAGVSNNKALV